MALKIFYISVIFSVSVFGFTSKVLAQDEKQDSILQITIELKIGELTGYDYKLGSGVGYIVFNIKNKRINVLELNCSNTALYKRLYSLDSMVLVKGCGNPNTTYLICIGYISENSTNAKLFWNNNESYEGLHRFQWGKPWKNVTVLKPISVYTFTPISKKVPKQNTDR